jgi:PKD repeat protein
MVSWSWVTLIVVVTLLLSATPVSAQDAPRACTMDESRMESDGPPYPPCPKFEYTPEEPRVAEEVTFDASESYQPVAGEISRYIWYLDDSSGSDATGVTVTKTFDEPGEHVVSLTAVNRAGERTNRERVVKVSNARPDAKFSYSPSEPRLDRELKFDASDSSDPAGEIQSYSWEFGDGTTASGESVNHSYDEYGEYQVSLTVSDGETTDTKTRTLVVDNLAPEPVVEFDSLPDEPTVNDEVVLNASDSYDPDGDGIAGYTWRFENGETATGAVVSHSFAEPGTREVTVTVSDGTDSTNRTVTVDVVNRPPEADFSHSPRTPTAGNTVRFNASLTTDPDNDVEEYVWEFGDGETARGKVVEYTYDDYGAYDVTLTVNDSETTDVINRTLTVEPGGESADGFGVFVTAISLLAASLVALRSESS